MILTHRQHAERTTKDPTVVGDGSNIIVLDGDKPSLLAILSGLVLAILVIVALISLVAISSPAEPTATEAYGNGVAPSVSCNLIWQSPAYISDLLNDLLPRLGSMCSPLPLP